MDTESFPIETAEILAKIEKWARSGLNLNFSENDFIFREAIGPEGMILYPDGSRTYDDFITLCCFITVKDDPVCRCLYCSLLHRSAFVGRIRFGEGAPTPFHSHNFHELAYIVRGEFRQNIEGQDVVFNEGEICLIDKAAVHGRERHAVFYPAWRMVGYHEPEPLRLWLCRRLDIPLCERH
jgi:hypothetical protein